ncbi:aldo/keto reductase [Microlunatus soli]|uniref:D-threo-aldose 1-dehydrogenase n=1 Tax=Microlunatus soli TaxID=630515 RepID=A0A1H1T6W0_9ACTN|nr:aldo/keto reductase [Microlunatus soli]SDS55950.1 D-threo-aldose 1-dehydrogenase [Microlunatus soli]
MDLATHRLGDTGLECSAIGIGTSPLGSMERLYGYSVAEQRAIDTVLATLDSPITMIDTSNSYGVDGSSELRIGAALRQAGGLPSNVLLATKVDPVRGSTDFSGARVRQSWQESKERLGVDRVPLLYLHDPERISFEDGMATDGPARALIELRDQGAVDHIGVAGGKLSILEQYVDTGEFEVLLNHNRYTLLDRSATDLFGTSRERGIGVINAAPYGGGMLAKGPSVNRSYAYSERDQELIDSAVAIERACARYEVPLAAAALQFSLRSPLVDSTVVGVSAPDRVQQTLDLAAVSIPDALWTEIEALAPTTSRLD